MLDADKNASCEIKREDALVVRRVNVGEEMRRDSKERKMFNVWVAEKRRKRSQYTQFEISCKTLQLTGWDGS